MLTETLIGHSNYFVQTFRMVVGHICDLALAEGDRGPHTKTALDILLIITKKTTLPLVDTAWINEILKSAAGGNMGDGTFTSFLRLSAQRQEDSQSLREAVPPETTTSRYNLFTKILRNVRICSGRVDGWEDEAVYGGLIAAGDIPQLGSCLPDNELLDTLYNAMEKVEEVGDVGKAKWAGIRPFRVRKAAYDIILIARDRWLRSTELRQTLQDRDFPRRLHSVVIETGRSDHQHSFLVMMEILSEDKYWHPYLRESMNIWLSFRHEGPNEVLSILSRVGELPLLVHDGPNHTPVDYFLEKLVEDEWARVPGCLPMDLTADRLGPLAEVTMRFKELLFTESDRRAVLAVVEQVIPSLEKRRDNDYKGPGGDILCIISGLLEILRVPVRSADRGSTYW